MSSNRTIIFTIGIAALLVAVFVLASMFPFGDVDQAQPMEQPTASEPTTEPTEEPAESDSATASGASGGQASGNASIETDADSENSADASEPSQSEETQDSSDIPTEDTTTEDTTTEDTTTEDANRDDVKIYTFNVLNSYPHDPEAFTQGLIWYEGLLYEGTGLRGRSTLRRVNLVDGAVEQKIDLQQEFFGEGITIFDDRIYQLTWQSNLGFVYDLATFDLLSTFIYPTEGWGITHDGERLIMSDGSDQIFFLDPETQERVGSISVTLRGEPIDQLNELEYINGILYSNIWQTDWIAMIDPETGVITGMANMAGLLQPPAGHNLAVDVLNGIAYDAENERLFVTGKLWPQLYEVELVEANQ